MCVKLRGQLKLEKLRRTQADEEQQHETKMREVADKPLMSLEPTRRCDLPAAYHKEKCFIHIYINYRRLVRLSSILSGSDLKLVILNLVRSVFRTEKIRIVR